jgi:hypothetical protein
VNPGPEPGFFFVRKNAAAYHPKQDRGIKPKQAEASKAEEPRSSDPHTRPAATPLKEGILVGGVFLPHEEKGCSDNRSTPSNSARY